MPRPFCPACSFPVGGFPKCGMCGHPLSDEILGQFAGWKAEDNKYASEVAEARKDRSKPPPWGRLGRGLVETGKVFGAWLATAVAFVVFWGAVLGGCYGVLSLAGSTDTNSSDGSAEVSGDCHESYEGECLDPTSYDYDCASGSGDGPDYAEGPVEVVGPDDFGLDRDGNGVGCES